MSVRVERCSFSEVVGYGLERWSRNQRRRWSFGGMLGRSATLQDLEGNDGMRVDVAVISEDSHADAGDTSKSCSQNWEVVG